MTGFVMFLHAIVSILLMVIILMQSGRGGGLTESFASAESMFGAQTNEFMIKATTVFASLFLVTCLGIAILSAQKGKSLMSSNIASETRPSAAPPTQAVDAVNDKTQEPVKKATTVSAKDAESSKDALPGGAPASTIPEGQ